MLKYVRISRTFALPLSEHFAWDNTGEKMICHIDASGWQWNIAHASYTFILEKCLSRFLKMTLAISLALYSPGPVIAANDEASRRIQQRHIIARRAASLRCRFRYIDFARLYIRSIDTLLSEYCRRSGLFATIFSANTKLNDALWCFIISARASVAMLAPSVYSLSKWMRKRFN